MRDQVSVRTPGSTAVAQLLLVGVLIVTLVFSSSIVPGFAVADDDSGLDDGNGTVSSVYLEEDALKISPGRYGTAVHYLRIPDATVAVDDVVGHPRIVYNVHVPGLGIDTYETELITGPGGTTVRMADVAILPEELSKGSYDGRVSVRVQSFSADWAAYNESITFEVEE